MINKIIDKAKNIAIICHIRPDGDAIGSALAMMHALKKLGKKACVFCESDIPSTFSFLKGAASFKKEFDAQFDLYISVDCADATRLGNAFCYDFCKKTKTLNIDHHISNTRFAKYNIVKDCAATCELVYLLLEELNISLDIDIATCLYTGIITDTGNFMHSNTTAQLHRIAANLIELGVEHCDICQKVISQKSLNKVRLIQRALESLKFFQNDRIAIITLLKKDFKETNCGEQHTEGIVDLAKNIIGVEIGICISQQNQNLYKVSYRSKGDINVASAASVFGGGGHLRAAGCSISGAYEDVVDKVIKSCVDQFPF